MRRLMLSMLVVSALISMVGCQCIWTHGICDCEPDEYCSSRSPWIMHGSTAAVPSYTVPATIPESLPAPMPGTKKLSSEE
jgi:hypothetical protein